MTSYQIALMNPIGQHPFDSIDRLFQDAVSASESQGAPWTPPCNVWEDEQGFSVQLALPGWEPRMLTLSSGQSAAAPPCIDPRLLASNLLHRSKQRAISRQRGVLSLGSAEYGSHGEDERTTEDSERDAQCCHDAPSLSCV